MHYICIRNVQCCPRKHILFYQPWTEGSRSTIDIELLSMIIQVLNKIMEAPLTCHMHIWNIWHIRGVSIISSNLLSYLYSYWVSVFHPLSLYFSRSLECLCGHLSAPISVQIKFWNINILTNGIILCKCIMYYMKIMLSENKRFFQSLKCLQNLKHVWRMLYKFNIKHL